jgi:hypothetical protein
MNCSYTLPDAFSNTSSDMISAEAPASLLVAVYVEKVLAADVFVRLLLWLLVLNILLFASIMYEFEAFTIDWFDENNRVIIIC